MQTHDPHFFGPFFVIGSDHSPFGGGNVFGGVKRKDGYITDTADFFAVINSLDGMGGVFDNEQIVFLGDG